MTVREHSQVSMVVTKFLIVDYLLAFNGVIGRPLLKALKAVTSTYHLIMKFSTIEETRRVKGTQYDSRECYNKSCKLAKIEKKLPQMMEVRVPSAGPMETNIDPHLQEDESATGSIEELVEMQVDPNGPSRVVKIGKNLKNELVVPLVEFLKKNLDMFTWTHVDMVRIHLDVICH